MPLWKKSISQGVKIKTGILYSTSLRDAIPVVLTVLENYNANTFRR